MGMPIYFYHAQSFELWHTTILIHLILCVLLMLTGVILDLTRAGAHGILELPTWLKYPTMIGFLWGLFSFPFPILTHFLLVSMIWDLGGHSVGIGHLLLSLAAFASFWYGFTAKWRKPQTERNLREITGKGT